MNRSVQCIVPLESGAAEQHRATEIPRLGREQRVHLTCHLGPVPAVKRAAQVVGPDRGTPGMERDGAAKGADRGLGL